MNNVTFAKHWLNCPTQVRLTLLTAGPYEACTTGTLSSDVFTVGAVLTATHLGTVSTVEA